ncbi:MAG: motif [Pseudomonadota bacterium]
MRGACRAVGAVWMRLSLIGLCVMGPSLMALSAHAAESGVVPSVSAQPPTTLPSAAPSALPDTRPPEMPAASQTTDATFARAAQPSASAPVKAVTQIPEPGTWVLMGMGLVAIALARRHRLR